METELKQQVEKPFFDRKEYVFEIKDKGTPSYDVLKQEISKKLNLNADLMAIKRVKHYFGKQSVLVNVYVYNSVESLKKYEQIKEEKKAAQPAK